MNRVPEKADSVLLNEYDSVVTKEKDSSSSALAEASVTTVKQEKEKQGPEGSDSSNPIIIDENTRAKKDEMRIEYIR